MPDERISKQERWRQKRVARQELYYLGGGPSPDAWRSMSPRQKAVYVRWRNWYRKRRAMRELLRGDQPKA